MYINIKIKQKIQMKERMETNVEVGFAITQEKEIQKAKSKKLISLQCIL